MKLTRLFSIFGLSAAITMHAATNVLTVDVAKPVAKVPATMYGLFFEDINFAADGGLYAELVKNRSFEFPQPFMGWDTFGRVELRDDGHFDRNPHYVRLSAPNHHAKTTGLTNEGYFGMGFEKDSTYRFTVWARTAAADGVARLRVELIDPSSRSDSQALAENIITVSGPDWVKYETLLKPTATSADGRLRVILGKPETAVDLEHLSLFPAATWRGQDNGLRADLAGMLADVRPGVFRFPGGCIVEGTDTDTRYKWKESVGPVENRPTNESRWRDCFDYRLFPDYYQSYGLGFYEFFRLAEDMGAEPLPVVSVGLACQFQNNASEQPPVDSLGEYIRDALDLIEFANGAPDTPWGAIRAQMGHPEPFNMKFLGIGNEQWGPEYVERLEPFLKALRSEHPEIRVVGSSGPYSEGPDFDYLWPEMIRLGADLVDEHYYRDEDFFLSQADRYDNYDRNGPKVFAGEYSCHVKGEKYNHFKAALCEAAFMTGLERNADIVEMATYAPLLAHIDGWQWRPDMIWFDNLRAMPTSSYYIQQLFSTNRGTDVLPLKLNGSPAIGADGLYASAVADSTAGTVIVKVANISDSPRQLRIDFDGMDTSEHITGGRLLTFGSKDLSAENTLDDPHRLVPVESPIGALPDHAFTATIAPTTFCVYIFNISH